MRAVGVLPFRAVVIGTLAIPALPGMAVAVPHTLFSVVVDLTLPIPAAHMALVSATVARVTRPPSLLFDTTAAFEGANMRMEVPITPFMSMVLDVVVEAVMKVVLPTCRLP